MISKNQHLTRQMDLIPLEVLTTPINIIGGGAIGSFTTLALAKMGFENITVYDDDSIDVENMNCQFFRFKDIGQKKVTALADLIYDFTNTEIMPLPMRWTGQLLNGITICAVDSMEVRKEVFEAYYKIAEDSMMVIDPRMGAETAMLYAYKPMSIEQCEGYKKTLYSDADAVQERCTAKSTMYTACMLSGLVAKTVKNIVCKEEYPRNLIWDIGKDDMIALQKGVA